MLNYFRTGSLSIIEIIYILLVHILWILNPSIHYTKDYVSREYSDNKVALVNLSSPQNKNKNKNKNLAAICQIIDVQELIYHSWGIRLAIMIDNFIVTYTLDNETPTHLFSPKNHGCPNGLPLANIGYLGPNIDESFTVNPGKPRCMDVLPLQYRYHLYVSHSFSKVMLM